MQNFGLVVKKGPRRISLEIPGRWETMRSIRVRGTPQTLATFPVESPSGSMTSSRSISPGCMGSGPLPLEQRGARINL
jgi:hypothetical protein